jgi:hypothetical protein
MKAVKVDGPAAKENERGARQAKANNHSLSMHRAARG